MKTRCKHCQRQCDYEEVANAHTVFEKQGTEATFVSTDDTFGIDICQVCDKPPLIAKLFSKKLQKLDKEAISWPKSLVFAID
ncbi:MAG: hypothetical protein MUE30_10675 [Spirosomaceae bacterium]|nr:hypothetical protein [Spirosomataceae bacterium]